ncbi:MAG: diaminobutyrate acetyltransferase [Rhodopirellula sp.]|nr:diaminobutyrate acetyltransferase [Rhodopirellula sp.]
MRAPATNDASEIWRLVRESGVLDQNSAYLYLLLCRDFSDTCLVAESEQRIVGFVTAYRLPTDSRTLFIWQVGVCASARRQGIALKMLAELVNQTRSLDFIEATVAPSNLASRRLFESLARGRGVSLTDIADAGFLTGDFPPGDHEAEPLLRIGPLSERIETSTSATFDCDTKSIL